jgi:hypothetical protein
MAVEMALLVMLEAQKNLRLQQLVHVSVSDGDVRNRKAH